MVGTRRSCLVLAGWGWGLGWGQSAWAQAQGATVCLALSDSGGAYAEAAEVFRQELEKAPRPPQLVVAPWHELTTPPQRPPQLVVTLGVAAYRGVAEGSRPGGPWARVPLLAGLLPRSAFVPVPGRSQQMASAVYLDQPVDRYLRLIDRALPGRRRVGVLWGPTSHPLRADLSKAAQVLGMRLVEATLPAQAEPGEVYSALLKVLPEVDVLLGLPDPLVFNAQSLQNLLITTYRQRVPFFSYAASHVAAGATAALHVTPKQVGARLAALARTAVSGSLLPGAMASPDFEVALNAQVGRSLGLALPTADALVLALRQSEGLQ